MPAARKTITEYEMTEIAKKAAREAVAEVFDKMGVDVHDKDELQKYAEDKRYTRENRLASEELRKQARTGFFYLMGVGLLGIVLWMKDLIYAGLVELFNK